MTDKPRKYVVRSINDWDYETDPALTGVIESFGKLPPEYDERRFVVIDTGTMRLRVYESWDLQDVFVQATSGMHISLKFLGTKSIKGNKTVKRFASAVWTE